MVDDNVLIKDCVQHWNRLIKWMKKQKGRVIFLDYERMKEDIGESWYRDDCALCKEYYKNWCVDCPLCKKYGSCGDSSSKNLYGSVRNAVMWETATKKAIKFRNQLKRLITKDGVRENDI